MGGHSHDHNHQRWKGTSYVPKDVHPALHWHKSDRMDMLPVVTDSPWQIVQKSKQQDKKYNKSNNINFVPADGSIPVSLKQKSEDTDESHESTDLKNRK